MSTYLVGVACGVGVGPTKGGRARNEDNYLIGRDKTVRFRLGDAERLVDAPSDPALVLAVADGMGGHEDGEVASTTSVQALARLYGRPRSHDAEAGLRDFLLETHLRLRPSVAVAGVVRMGTTVTLVQILGGRAIWGHVGDSRLYLFRGGQLTCLTRDHTRAEFARRDSRPEPQYPQHLSQNFLYGSRGLGNDESLRIDKGVDTGDFRLLLGDRLLLCSDGVHGYLGKPDLITALGAESAQAAADALVQAAMDAQSDDNVTALVLDVVGDPAAQPEREPDEDWRGGEDTLVPVSGTPKS